MGIVSGGSGGGLAAVSRTLTDAQVKTLPTVPFVLVAATQTLAYSGVPASLPVAVSCGVVVKRPGGDYTNVDAAAHLRLCWGSDESMDIASLERPVGTEPTSSNAFAGGAGAHSRGAAVLTSYNQLGSVTLDDQLQDNALAIVLRNGALGNLTGGGGANSAVISLVYYICAV